MSPQTVSALAGACLVTLETGARGLPRARDQKTCDGGCAAACAAAHTHTSHLPAHTRRCNAGSCEARLTPDAPARRLYPQLRARKVPVY